MHKPVKFIPLLMTGILLAACTAQAVRDIEITTRRQPDFDPANYNTYAWLETAQIVNDPLGQWEPPNFDADAEVERLIDRELAKQRFSRSNSNPDLLVTFVAGIDMADLELREDPDKKQTTLQNIPRGALVAILVDAASRERLWVGVAMADVARQSDTNAVRRRLDYAISGMFRGFPGK
jgi:hypothetical protein